MKPSAAAIVCAIKVLGAVGALAQTGSAPTTIGPSSPPASIVVPSPTPATRPGAGPTAREVKGLDVFGVDGRQVGKVVAVTNRPNGKLHQLEVHSSGFLGYFSKVFMIPSGMATVDGGRVQLAVSSDQVSQWEK